ncbi:four helix bundle protein [Candidatus Falkowbacteria bacterium CG11_big_fil_rev_8_21_14_0_20_39_10]|uniref:Four helix bundle protein n=1 Tax=Candidatus Falkowbacteria bacterium CG11_big_fil_rev_8_21_14_0_20_39_10 TaxID=1974570 RepID=A0A2M6K9W6_9BACT|nr:MAG: four helix bundle protein [Candidatus Falkowbacteria bacterium CG11_big_fil_rev_8_21_14_0_20_39_10]
MEFHDKLKIKMHLCVKYIYRITRNFPKDELYGVTSQLRRAALSIILNYIEGYARRKSNNCKVYKNFLEISYGSLKETKYLIYFSYTEGYINKEDYQKLLIMNDEIGKMLWSTISHIK